MDNNINSIYSTSFAKMMAQAKADANNDGKIDDNEKGIFDNYLKKFDLNSDKEISDSEVTKFFNSIRATQDMKDALAELNAFEKSKGITSENYNEKSQELSVEERNKLLALYDRANLSKQMEFTRNKRDMLGTIRYLTEHKLLDTDNLLSLLDSAIKYIDEDN